MPFNKQKLVNGLAIAMIPSLVALWANQVRLGDKVKGLEQSIGNTTTDSADVAEKYNAAHPVFTETADSGNVPTAP